jgi:hypothetical protein
MKYTRYIVDGRPIRPEELGVVALPAAAVGVVVLCGLLPGAIIMDGGRYLKLRYLLFKREQRNLNYIRCVLRSLDREPNNQLINLLKVA